MKQDDLDMPIEQIIVIEPNTNLKHGQAHWIACAHLVVKALIDIHPMKYT